MFQGNLKGFSRKFKGVQVRLKGISSSCKEVSRVFEISSTSVSGKLQWCFKEVSKKFQGSFRSGLRESREFQENFMCVSRKNEGCLKGVFSFQFLSSSGVGLKRFFSEVHGYLKEISGKFQMSFKDVSMVFQESF